MRREELYLNDIVEAAESIQRFLAGIEREIFLQNDLLRSAVLQKLTIIGEAVARLPMEFRDRHPEMEWDDISWVPQHSASWLLRCRMAYCLGGSNPRGSRTETKGG